ncbi:MAG TPA: hypothetical protein PK530_14050 [Anaerolineales bacterium]|nr:hypothetical protein [Anaerolineales bacterium]
MKTRLLIIFMIFAMLMAACQPAAPVQDTPQPTETPSNGVSFNEETGNEVPFSDAPRPVDVVWNHDPNTLIVSGTYCCGFTMPLVPLNYIPDFQIWGDGRYVWVVFNADNTSRQVLEGQLTEEQMTTLLQKFADAGFFGWEDRYANELVSDMADQCITVNLEGVSKTVCEYYEGAPKEFHALYDELAKGSGITGTAFVPTRGYLTAFDMGKLARPVSQDDILWPTDQLFPLSDAVDKGMWVEGEALLLAWEAINKNPYEGLVYASPDFYGIALQIPGLSMNQPPTDTQ